MKFVGKCVTIDGSASSVDYVPCKGAHDGKVTDAVVFRVTCPYGTSNDVAYPYQGTTWYLCIDNTL